MKLKDENSSVLYFHRGVGAMEIVAMDMKVHV